MKQEDTKDIEEMKQEKAPTPNELKMKRIKTIKAELIKKGNQTDVEHSAAVNLIDTKFFKTPPATINESYSFLDKIDNNRPYLLTVSGYKNLNCNMTCLIYDKKLTIIDAGSYTEVPENLSNLESLKHIKECRKGADLSYVFYLIKKGYKLENVIITHAHGDHIGGIELLSEELENTFNYDLKEIKLWTTDYTYEYYKKNIKFTNKFFLENDQHYDFDEEVKLHSFYLNHSSLHSVALYFEIKGKKLLFLPDHRVDYEPGLKRDSPYYVDQIKVFDILKKINKEAPDLTVFEGTRGCSISTKVKLNLPEKVVCLALKNTIKYFNDHKRAIIISSYATNPIRLKTVIETAYELDRKVLVMGSSMVNGVEVAFKKNLIDKKFKNICNLGNDLTNINPKKQPLIILCTGHMGEDRGALSKLLKGQIKYNWSKDDLVILSSTTIPKEGAEYNRLRLICRMKARRVLILDGDNYPFLHTSGHISDQDYQLLIATLKCSKKFMINHGDLRPINSILPIFKENNIKLSRVLTPDNHTLSQI